MKEKKSVIGPIISVFVLILVVAILAGLAFLFITNLQTQAVKSSVTATFVVNNESGWLNSTPYTLALVNEPGFSSLAILNVTNSTNSSQSLAFGNFSQAGYGLATLNATGVLWNNINITYSYVAVGPNSRNAVNSINATANAGSQVIAYLPLIFLAVIFGAILILVLRVILPYLNIGGGLPTDGSY